MGTSTVGVRAGVAVAGAGAGAGCSSAARRRAAPNYLPCCISNTLLSMPVLLMPVLARSAP